MTWKTTKHKYIPPGTWVMGNLRARGEGGREISQNSGSRRHHNDHRRPRRVATAPAVFGELRPPLSVAADVPSSPSPPSWCPGRPADRAADRRPRPAPLCWVECRRPRPAHGALGWAVGRTDGQPCQPATRALCPGAAATITAAAPARQALCHVPSSQSVPQPTNVDFSGNGRNRCYTIALSW